jgi:hypothetical protein
MWLPRKGDAIELLDYYAENVGFLHHVVHIPFVKEVLSDVYRSQLKKIQIRPNYLALLFAILASSAASYGADTNTTALFSSPEEAIESSIQWATSALDVLEHCRRIGRGSLEEVQANIIISFLVINLEGFSVAGKAAANAALYMAREISLHKTDAHVVDSLSQNDAIQLEIKRRVLWHLVSTDWYNNSPGSYN